MDPRSIHNIYTNKYTFSEIKKIYDSELLIKHRKKVKTIILPNNHKYRLTDTFNLFMEKGNVCRACGKIGLYFLEIPKKITKYESLSNIFLYTEDGKLMTGDHIIPKSAGGSGRMMNMQPMCTICNWVKDDKIPEVEMDYLYNYRQILDLVLSKHPQGTIIGDKFYNEYKITMRYRCIKKMSSLMNLDEVQIYLYLIKDEYKIDIKLEDLRVKLAPKITVNNSDI
jgi:hypothetical protein